MFNIFGTVFLLERRLTRLADRALADDDITTKQWLVLAAVDKLFATPPSLQQVARALNTSHQNIKAIAAKLVDKGLLELVRDQQDRRITRLRVTAENTRLWAAREQQDLQFFGRLGAPFSDAELTDLEALLTRLSATTVELESPPLTPSRSGDSP
jgi:DNA-binding MarR family transcriptional regulator